MRSLIDGYAKTGGTSSGQTVDLYEGSSDSFRTYMINSLKAERFVLSLLHGEFAASGCRNDGIPNPA